MNFEKAKALKEAGFPQKRHDHAKYYLNENVIAYFEDIKNAFRASDWEGSRNEVVADWMENFTYLPELVDFIGIPQYNLTLDMAANKYLDGKNPQETVQQTKKTIIDERTLETIEKTKDAIKKVSQSK